MTDKKEDYSQYLANDDQLQEILDITDDLKISDNDLTLAPKSNTPLIAPVIIKDSISIDPDIERDEDYSYARETYKGVIDTAQDALNHLSQIAKSSNEPRAFEVLSYVMNSIVEANKKMFELHKQKQDLELKKLESESKRHKPESTQVTNNNLFVGSSTQLLDFIKELKDK